MTDPTTPPAPRARAGDTTSGAAERSRPATSTAAQEGERRATIDDVAHAAGVSVATVSRALRNLPNVAETTRRRVQTVAADLNYRPDPSASPLAARKTRTITVGVPSLSGWYFSTVVAGAEPVCREEGFDFQVIGIASLAERDRLLDDTHQLERRTDGLILVDVEATPDQAEALTRRGVALATIGNTLDGHPSVRIDDRSVGRLAAEHLLGKGHRRLGLIDGRGDDPMNFVVPVERRAGFDEAVRRAGVGLDADLVVAGNFDVDGGRAAMRRLLDLDEPPTGVFAMSDEMAFGAIMELDERGLRPGTDIAIVGVDDHEFSRVARLTTIRQPVADHGAAATRLLIGAIRGEPVDERHHVRPEIELVERESSRCSPVAG